MRWRIEGEAPGPPKAMGGGGVSARKGFKRLVIDDLSLATPMLGGGVESLKVDKDMPIRGQSVRGQLRFWWRTFQSCETVDDLRKREDAIWGSTRSASRVSVEVDIVSANWRTIRYDKDMKKEDTELPKYVIFPLDNTKDDKDQYIKQFDLIEGGRFKLTVFYDPDYESDVLNSLKLWYLFGGLGARTRRGMGSLYIVKDASRWPGWKSESDIENWLKNAIPSKDQGAENLWPSLIGAKLLMTQANLSPQKPIKKAWVSWIGKYQGFRQWRVDKKTGKRSTYGKSIWPEPDAIRDFHNQNNQFEKSAFFPRGAYGLPILFHFPQEKMDYTLFGGQSADGDRWASPIFLKVLKLSESRAVNICLKLQSPMPAAWSISGHERQSDLPKSAVPMALHPRRQPPPLDGKDPYAALFNAMGADIPITLGTGGAK